MFRAAVACLIGSLLAGLDAAPVTRVQPDPITEVRALLDAGRYEQAAAKAAALQPSTAPDPARTIRILQLQVEARLRNGEGASPETLALARGLLSGAPAGAPADASAASHGLLGEALFDGAHFGAAVLEFEAAARLH